MKNKIYTLICLFGLTILSIQAQDITLTNTKLDPPVGNDKYGQACFTIIAEEGIEVTNVPFKVAVSLSKVNFDEDGVFGFNSKRFDWERDVFSDNVLIGELKQSILSVEDGDGGAQICIPVNRDNKDEYNESRNGFVVNLIPGGIDQDAFNDDIAKFGFSSGNQSSIINTENDINVQQILGDTYEIDLTVFPNPATDIVNIKSDIDREYMKAIIYNYSGNILYQNNNYLNADQINVHDWAKGLYIIELIDNNSNTLTSKKLVLD